MYGLRGLGVFDPPARPAFIDPGYPPDPGIVAQNTANNNAYQRQMELAQASNNYDQCEANAQNATSQAQYDQVMAMCRGQAAQQTGPEAGDLPVTYFTPGRPLSYSPGGPAIPPPVYSVPTFAQNAPAFQPVVSPTPTVATPSVPPTVPASPVPTGSPAQQPPVLGSSLMLPATGGGFSLDSIPMWAWIAAAGVGFMAFGGKDGR